jgi:hypothetical protein
MKQIRPYLRNYIVIYVLWVAALWILTGGLADPSDWLHSWNSWDALWYEKIWNNGYSLAEPMALAFPPAYSLLVGSLSKISSLNFHITSMILNTFAYFMAAVLAAEVLARQFSIPRWVIFIFTLSSPTSYFIFTSYSDSIFALLLWTTIFAALFYPNSTRARIAEAGLLFTMPWFRLTGYALASWLVLKRWTALVVFLSLAGWFCFNWTLTNQVGQFLNVQKMFSMPEGGVFAGLEYTLQYLLPIQFPSTSKEFDSWLQFHLLPIVYLVALAATGIWLAYRRQWLLAVTLGSILFMSHNQGFWRSVIRYNLPLMPMLGVALWFLGLRIGRHKVYRSIILTVVIVAQFLLQVYFAELFRNGYWAF